MNNKKGFTLIELLAVITIMGILMLVAIPAISRTIENSRRSTFLNTAQSYIKAVKRVVTEDQLSCGGSLISAVENGFYYIRFSTMNDTANQLLEQGGKSAWGSANVWGVVVIDKTDNNNNMIYEYSIVLVDSEGRGIGKFTDLGRVSEAIDESYLSRSMVYTKDGNNRKKFTNNNDPLPHHASTGETRIRKSDSSLITVNGPIECFIN